MTKFNAVFTLTCAPDILCFEKPYDQEPEEYELADEAYALALEYLADHPSKSLYDITYDYKLEKEN